MRAVTALAPLALPSTLVFWALAFGSCAPPASIYCTSDNDCPSDYACDQESRLCLPSVEGTDAGEFVDGAQDAAGFDRARDAAEMDHLGLDAAATDQERPDQEALDSHVDDVNIVIDGGPRDLPDDGDLDASLADLQHDDLANDQRDTFGHDQSPLDIGPPDQDPGEMNTGRVDSSVFDATAFQDSSLPDNFFPDNDNDPPDAEAVDMTQPDTSWPDTSSPDIGAFDAANLCTLIDSTTYDPSSCGSGDWRCSDDGVCRCGQAVICEDFCPPTPVGFSTDYCCSDADCTWRYSGVCDPDSHTCSFTISGEAGVITIDGGSISQGCADQNYCIDWNCSEGTPVCKDEQCVCDTSSWGT